jgi:TPR repeat protein
MRKDAAEALRWYLRSAQAGDGAAMDNQGIMYEGMVLV